MPIHPQAAVSPYAILGENVKIGPFCVVEPGVVIGDNSTLSSRVAVKSGTTLGRGNHICEGAVLGGLPQHVHMPESPGRLTIGDGNVIRENVTIHRAMDANKSTRIGSFCLIMVGAHVAHDCSLGDNVIMTNNALLGGHVHVEDRAYISGAVAVHQFCRIGSLAMVGGLARVRQDVPPFVTVDGGTTMVVGLNRVGLRRAGLTAEHIDQIKSAYKLIYRSGLPWDEMLEVLEQEFTEGPAAEFAVFFRNGQRGFVQERRTPPGATVRLVRDEDDAQPLSHHGAEKMAG
ncbi:MAG TPA: acyl-ACP--UDP-N-acetylglucosamine O-acyltransferase [Lacipirellulaceae bacterium]